jgi:hypothetical protein
MPPPARSVPHLSLVPTGASVACGGPGWYQPGFDLSTNRGRGYPARPGPSHRMEPKASTKPKSALAASTPGTLHQNYGKPQSPRPVLHPRNRRRNRPSRRLQFPVGLVLRCCAGTGDVSESNRFSPVLFRRRNGPVVTRGHASKAVTLIFISHRSRPGCRRLYRGRNQVA